MLAEEERQTLALRFLHGVLGVVQHAQQQLGAAGIVVSPDPGVLALAVDYNLTPLLEDLTLPPASDYGLRITDYAEPGLNAALEQATAFAIRQGASAVLVLPADLPLLTLAEVDRLWRDSQQLYSARAMVIAPDSRVKGPTCCWCGRPVSCVISLDRAALIATASRPASLEWPGTSTADAARAGRGPSLRH